MDTTYYKGRSSIIDYKVMNNSNKKFFIIMNNDYFDLCDKQLPNCYSVNINIRDEKGNIPKPQFHFSHADETFLCYKYTDSMTRLRYKEKQLGVYNDSAWVEMNRFISRNIVTIGPNETLYFRNQLTLPKRKIPQYPHEVLVGYLSSDFDTTKIYYAQLNFNNTASEVKKYLTDIQLRNIEENGYTVFDGIVYSNKIPVKYKPKNRKESLTQRQN